MHDIDVRAAVREELQTLHGDDPATRIVEEMGIWAGTVRIDIAVINGELSGFELKSARDTLERLPHQSALYNEVFDRMVLVIAERHAKKARRLIPGWWGISVATENTNGKLRIEALRRSKPNPAPNPIQIARLLWRTEALAILEKYELVKGFRSKPAEVLATRLAAELHVQAVKDEVRHALKARCGWLGKEVAD